MGRNTKKYAYPLPRFDLHSEVWQKLLEDAKRTGKPVADLIVIRLADFYKGKRDEPMNKQPEAPVVASTSDINKNALAAAQAWGDDDDTPTEPYIPAIQRE